MTVRKILTIPDSVLRKVSTPVENITQEISALIQDMFETMYQANGIGLAAIQIGVDKRVIVMDLARKDEASQKRHFINPEILELSEEKAVNQEGCLSIPDYFNEVERSVRCKISYLTERGETVTEWAEGLYAVCIQHEIDHLNGVLFIDYLSRLKRQRAVAKVKKNLVKQKVD